MAATTISRRFRWSSILVFTMALLAAPGSAASQPSGSASHVSSCGTRGVGSPALACNNLVFVSTNLNFTCALDGCFVSYIADKTSLRPVMFYEPLRTMSGQWRLYLCHSEPRAGESLDQCDAAQSLEVYDAEALAAYYERGQAIGFPKALKDQLNFARVTKPCSLLVWSRMDTNRPFVWSAPFVVTATTLTDQELQQCLRGKISRPFLPASQSR